MRRFAVRREEIDGDGYSALAEGQGVLRPYRILLGMPAAAREHLAAILGIRLAPGDSPEAQAWAIINSDIRGIQARSHGPVEQLVPYARNHNWWEIIMTAARRLKLQVYPGLSEREVERLVFEAAATRVVQALSSREVEELDRLAGDEPSLASALSSLGLSRDGLRLVMAGLGRVARCRWTHARASLRRCAGSYVTSGMNRMGRLPTMSRSLRFVKEAFHGLIVAWSSMASVSRSVGRARARFMSVLMALYFHSLIEEGLDEVEVLKA